MTTLNQAANRPKKDDKFDPHGSQHKLTSTYYNGHMQLNAKAGQSSYPTGVLDGG
jgi:hypothetical protein